MRTLTAMSLVAVKIKRFYFSSKFREIELLMDFVSAVRAAACLLTSSRPCI